MNNKKILLNKLFPCPPSKKYCNLQIDNESVSYITTPINAELISTIIESLIPKNISHFDITIFDGTACVGGDSITFGKFFGKVIAVEIDIYKYNMLVNNIKEYELENIITINDDCIKILKTMNNIDIVYIDPPWGGKYYKDNSKLRLSIGGMYIDELVNMIFNKELVASNVKMIVFKLPKNYDLYTFYELTKSPKITIMMFELFKMIVVICNRFEYT